MMRKLIFIVTVMMAAALSAQTVYKLEGKIGGTIPVVIELEDDDGVVSGQYAYRSTLQKSGDHDCSWLMINPSYEEPATQWTIRDCRPMPVETWRNVRFDGSRLTARLTNDKGKTYDVTATVTQKMREKASLKDYLKQHICEAVSDFDMFNYLPVKFRLISMMGTGDYYALKEIYQTQGDMEYTKGMFLGSGYMARQCCDPAVVWAYDPVANAFYIWMLRDGRERWWSETGNVPVKFREAVNERF